MLFISLTICTLASFQAKAQTATIWTDKTDYHPGETVTIYGTDFLPNANVAINVTKQSDGTVSSFNVISDSNGNFTTSYQIGNVGATLYTVTATDGTNTATTTFTDSTFGIDTNCEGFGSISRSQSVPITTTSMTAQANELIIIVITQGNLGPRIFEHFTITDSFSSHLSYMQRGTTLRSGRNGEAISEYYAVTSSSQTGSFRITVIPHRYNRENIDVQVFGILGANTASPFDSHSGLPYTGYSKRSSIPTVTGVSTSNANDIILGLEGNSGSTAETAGSYFTGTILHNVNSEGDNVGYKTVTSTLSSSSIAFGTRVTNWVMYVDAVRPALSVSVSPSSWTMDMGQAKTFTAAPSGGSGSYTRYQWYVGEVAQIGATASTFSYSPASVGSHSITVTVTDSLGVTSPQSTGVTVTVNSALVAPTASASKGTVDQGQTSALSSTAVSTGTSPYTYQWLQKAPDAGSYSAISGATSSGYSFVTSGSTTIGSWSFELQVTDSASTPVVVTSAAVSVVVNAAPTVSTSPSSWTMDMGQAKTFTATASGGSGTYTSYQWYVNAIAQSGTASMMPFTPESSGTYSITVTVTDSLGVTSALSSAASVTVAASPTVSIAPVGPLTMDAGQVQTFTATASGGSGTISYQWYVDGTAVGTNSASYSYTASGTSHTVTCTVTDSASTPVTSPASNAVTITVSASPTVSIAPVGPLTMDASQVQAFTSTPTEGSGTIHYQWYLGGSAVSGATSSTFSFSESVGSYSVTCKVTDSASTPVTSPASNAVSVTVNSALVAPTVTASPTTVDQGQTSALSFTAVSTGTSPYTYQWLLEAPGAGSYSAISGATSSGYSFATSGSTATGVWSFELQVTDSAGAVVTSSAATVTVNAAPTVTVSPTSWTMDVGQSEIFTATPSGGSGSYTGYQWYVDGAAQSGQTTQTFSYSPASAGSYSITATVTDSSGATSAQSTAATITVNSALATPTVSASKSTVDQGQTSSLTSTTVSTGTPPYTYQWLQEAPGTSSYSAIGGATSSTYSFATTGSTTIGAWSFELQVTDGASTPVMVTSTAASVTVNAAPTVTVSPTSWTMDVGQSKTFTATPSDGSGTYTSYQWYVGGVSQSGATASTFSFAPASAGSYSITATTTDSSGATSAQSTATSVTVNSALATPTVTPTPGTVDQGQTSSLTSTAVSTGTSSYTYQWLEKAPGGSYVTVGSNSGSFSFVTSGSTATGSWSFILQVTDNTGAAVNSTAVSVAVNAAPTVSIVPVGPVTLDAGQAQTFTASASGGTGTLTYQWYLNGSPVGVDSNTYIFSGSAGSYSVTCTVTDSASVPASAASNAVSVTVNQLTITVTQGANGVIAPGTTTVNYGSSQTFTITPNTGYYIASLSVDGSPLTAASSYTFSNIQAPHTISATFAITSTTPTVSPPSPTPTVSPPSPTPTVSPPSPTPLYLVLAAVIIVAAITILIFSVIAIKRRRRKPDSTLPNPENKHKKINLLAADEKQEIASVKVTIEKIKNLEAEKKNLLLEIEELKKMAGAKTALPDGSRTTKRKPA